MFEPIYVEARPLSANIQAISLEPFGGPGNSIFKDSFKTYALISINITKSCDLWGVFQRVELNLNIVETLVYGARESIQICQFVRISSYTILLHHRHLMISLAYVLYLLILDNESLVLNKIIFLCCLPKDVVKFRCKQVNKCIQLSWRHCLYCFPSSVWIRESTIQRT